jgi:hypothetical protein
MVGVAVGDTLHILGVQLSALKSMPSKSPHVYLILGEQRVADTGQEHHAHEHGNNTTTGGHVGEFASEDEEEKGVMQNKRSRVALSRL